MIVKKEKKGYQRGVGAKLDEDTTL